VSIHWTLIVVIFVCAMIAVPFFYNHRMNESVFAGGLIGFVGAPLFAGIWQQQADRLVALLAVVLLLLCPAVYAATDALAVEFEKLRDGYFLGTGSTLIFVSAAWLGCSHRSRNWLIAGAAALGLTSAALATCLLLLMVMYCE